VVHGKAHEKVLVSNGAPTQVTAKSHSGCQGTWVGHSSETHGLQGWQLAASKKRDTVIIDYFIAKSF